MNINRHRDKRRLTPEKTNAWTLALYPAIIMILVVFMVVTNRQVTTDIIGLFIGLVAAGSLQAAVQKKGNGDDKFDDSRRTSSWLHPDGREELETDDRRRPDDPNRRSYRRYGILSS